MRFSETRFALQSVDGKSGVLQREGNSLKVGGVPGSDDITEFIISPTKLDGIEDMLTLGRPAPDVLLVVGPDEAGEPLADEELTLGGGDLFTT